MNDRRLDLRRWVAWALCLGGCTVIAAPAVARAEGWDCPWANGSQDHINAGYGFEMHRGDADYALDFNWYGDEGTGGGNTDCGRQVLAIAAGQVRRSACSGKKADSGYGCHVEILHGDDVRGPRSFYAHLAASPTVAINQRVCGGGLIGHVGRTGSGGGSTCHLHFHMRTNGGRDALVPEPMQARRAGSACLGQTGLAAGQDLVSCIGYHCPPGVREEPAIMR
jgi:hypothetical protein